VLLGLEYIHEQGYVHKVCTHFSPSFSNPSRVLPDLPPPPSPPQDIKTQNMLLSSTGIVKLCDFGLVASIKMAQSEGNKDFTGTAHYMPPGSQPLPLTL
jgi:serine/threonine protein kinase